MHTLTTAVEGSSEAFQANSCYHRALADDLQEQVTTTALGGPARSRDRHVARGKLLPRDRVEALLDLGTPFLELSPLAAHGMYDGDAPGAGIITGVGQVSARRV